MKFRKIIAPALISAALLLPACGDDAEVTETVKKGWIKDNCRDVVKDRLRAPGTAKFSGESVSASGVHDYTVTGSVDSENGFGALLRSTYVCSATSSDGDRYNFNATVVE